MSAEFLLLEVIEYLHDQAIAAHGGRPGVLDQSLLRSAAARAENKFYYGGDDIDLFDLAAAYAFAFAKDHVFVDGNKRTAWAACILFLRVNGRRISSHQAAAEDAMLALAKGAMSEEDFSRWLRRHAL